MTTEDSIARFEREYMDYNRISEARQREQVKLLRQLADRLDKPLIEMDSSDLQGFAGDLVAAGLHVNTVRKKLNMVRPFISWAYAVGAIDADRYLKLRAVKNPRGSTGHTIPKPYSRKEITAFWTALDSKLTHLPLRGPGSHSLRRWLTGKGGWTPELRRHGMRLQLNAMVRLALDMGLRRSEIFRLSLDDLHYDNEYLVVHGKADPNTGEPKVREVPFTEIARAAVKDWVEFRALMRCDHQRPWVACFGQDYDQPMTDRRFFALLRDLVGIEWSWHRFRHTCATEWLRAGVELEKVQRLLGHATLQQTLCYAEVARGDLSKAMASREASFEEAVGRAA